MEKYTMYIVVPRKHEGGKNLKVCCRSSHYHCVVKDQIGAKCLIIYELIVAWGIFGSRWYIWQFLVAFGYTQVDKSRPGC